MYTHTYTRELEMELLQQELQQRDEELMATGAHTEHVHDTMLRLRSIYTYREHIYMFSEDIYVYTPIGINMATGAHTEHARDTMLRLRSIYTYREHIYVLRGHICIYTHRYIYGHWCIHVNT